MTISVVVLTLVRRAQKPVGSWCGRASGAPLARRVSSPRAISRGVIGWLGRGWGLWGSVTGARIESAWRALNAAEQELLMLLPAAVIHERIPGIRAALRNMIPPGDPRLGRYTADLDALET